AASVCWAWRAARPKEEVVTQRARRARLRGAAEGIAGGAIGALLLSGGHRAGLVVIGVAGLVVVAAVRSPLGAYATIERGLVALGRRVGMALTWVLMPAVFYLVFLPFGAAFRRGARDPMRRAFDRDVATYWKDRAADPTAADSRSRQY